jgi:hypothetical protein
MAILRTLIAACAASLFLAACDGLRTPGSDNGQTETPADTSTTTPGETDPVSEPTEPETPTTPETDPVSEPVTDPVEPETPAIPDISDLAEINAVNCKVFSTEGLTVAELMSAGDPEPSLNVGTAQVNGRPVPREEFPGLVKLEPAEDIGSAVGHGHCGTTRIGETWFITAAHCLDQSYDRIELVVGSETLSEGRRVVATRGICHAAYGGAAQKYTNDIALIEIAPEVAETLTDIPIAPLMGTSKAFTPRNYPRAFVAGWGLTDFNAGTLSNVLLQTELKVESVGPSRIRVSSIDGAGPCIGDSGGPIYVEEADGTRRLVGVLSAVEGNAEGKFCQGAYNAQYTNLAGFTDWVEQVKLVCDNRPELCELPQ